MRTQLLFALGCSLLTVSCVALETYESATDPPTPAGSAGAGAGAAGAAGSAGKAGTGAGGAGAGGAGAAGASGAGAGGAGASGAAGMSGASGASGKGGGGTGGAGSGGAGAGGSAGSSGSAGAGQGGVAGKGGAGGTGGSSGAGAAGAPTCNGTGAIPPKAMQGQPCTKGYASSCAQGATDVSLYCDPTTCLWAFSKKCDKGLLCNDAAGPDQGSCEAPPTACKGLTPGTAVCDGVNRIVCSDDPFVPTSSVACADEAHCQSGTGGKCAVCLTNEHKCVGNELQQCAADHLSFVGQTTCASAALCSADAGACTTAACTPSQQRCSGNTLQTCNAFQSGWDDTQTCGYCDPATFACLTCKPNSSVCASSSDLTVCAADGKSKSTSPCPDTSPICYKNVCIECTTAADCAPPGDCETVSCTLSHTCAYKFIPKCSPF